MSNCEQCIVRQISALKALGKAELLRIADCKTSTIIHRGEALFEEGHPIDGIYCIKDGACKLTKLSANGNYQIVRLAGKGELLGQRSMLSDEPANLSAIALQDLQVCFIPAKEILQFLDTNPQFSRKMLETLSHDLRQADDFLVDMAQKTVTARLAALLLYLETTFGKHDDGSISLELSREELAGLAGTATESCIRLLSGFRKQGLIQLEGRKVFIMDHARLSREL